MKFGLSPSSSCCLQEEGFPYHSIEEVSHLLKRFTKDRACDQGHQLYESLKKHHLETHPSFGNDIVSMLAELGFIHDAHHVFHKLDH